MASNYVIWVHNRVSNNVTLNSFKGFDSIWKVTSGESVARQFPADVKFFMHPDRPNDTILTDDLRNLQGLIIASERLTEFLKGKGLEKVEYLPVTIVDHKKKPTKQKFCIVNPIDPVDCIDKKKSRVEMSVIAPDDISEVHSLVIDEKKIPKGRQIARVAALGRVVLVSRKLAAELDKEKFTGLGWQEIDKFTTTPI